MMGSQEVLYQIFNTLKLNYLLQYRTGNFYIDTILSLFLVSLMPMMMKYGSQLYIYAAYKFKNWHSARKKYSVQFKGREWTSTKSCKVINWYSKTIK